MKLNFLALTIALLSGCIAAPYYSGNSMKNYDGKHFYNSIPSEKSLGDILRLSIGTVTSAERWPSWVNHEPRLLETSYKAGDFRVTFINHATTLIQVDGLNVLTDPIYAERASPFSWAGPRRVHSPGINFEDLPEIDVILISHNHYDHLDEETLKALFERQQNPPLLLAGLGNGLLFKRLGLEGYVDMQWDDQIAHDGVNFHFVECRHRSGRGISDQMKTLWGSFVMETKKGNIYFAGDTGYGPHFKQQAARFGNFALTILPIGAYEPRWFMAEVHLNPEEAVQAHLDLNSTQSLAVHFGTFQLTYEGIDQPAIDLKSSLARKGVSEDDFWVLSPGESRSVQQHFDLPAPSIAAYPH
jgi:L-ascorbate metabolism protein UlaG (beta-lactamase superfamily)